MPIALAPLNTDMRVVRVLLDDKTKKHLESLGILVNSSIKIISSVNGGVVVAVKEGRLLCLPFNILRKPLLLRRFI